MDVINWKLISHPLNWVILFLMVFIAGIGIHFILESVGAQQAA